MILAPRDTMFEVVPPPGGVELVENVDALFGQLAQDEQPELPAITSVDEARRRLLVWGGIGVIVGACFTAGLTGLAFATYKKSGSAVWPAAIAGGGALAVGGLTIWIASRAIGSELDPRLAAAAMGVKAAG